MRGHFKFLRTCLVIWFLLAGAPLISLVRAASQPFSCHRSTCQFNAGCSGELFEQIGCKIQCFKTFSDGASLIYGSGSADCVDAPKEQAALLE